MPPMSENSAISIGILTVSDRASRGEYEDLGGPAVRSCLAEWIRSPATIVGQKKVV